LQSRNAHLGAENEEKNSICLQLQSNFQVCASKLATQGAENCRLQACNADLEVANSALNTKNISLQACNAELEEEKAALEQKTITTTLSQWKSALHAAFSKKKASADHKRRLAALQALEEKVQQSFGSLSPNRSIRSPVGQTSS